MTLVALVYLACTVGFFWKLLLSSDHALTLPAPYGALFVALWNGCGLGLALGALS